MSYNIEFKLKDGQIDPESIQMSGDLKDRTVKVSGHEDLHQLSVWVWVDGISASATRAKPRAGDAAQAAYAAYGASTGGKNYQGLPMPAWEDLPAEIRAAWGAAAASILEGS